MIFIGKNLEEDLSPSLSLPLGVCFYFCSCKKHSEKKYTFYTNEKENPRELDFFSYLFLFHLAFIVEIECFMILHKRECIDVGAQIKISSSFSAESIQTIPELLIKPSKKREKRWSSMDFLHGFLRRKLKVNQKQSQNFNRIPLRSTRLGHFFSSLLQLQHAINSTWNECMLGMYLKLSMQNMYEGANCECNALNGTVFVCALFLLPCTVQFVSFHRKIVAFFFLSSSFTPWFCVTTNLAPYSFSSSFLRPHCLQHTMNQKQK